jgi:Predicted metal-dependent enzyme
MKPSGIGGMAVMEGVMMKNKDEYAVAVRKPNNEIVVEKKTHKDFSDKVKLFKLPIFRGILAFVDSLVLGVKVLNFSASFFEEEENEKAKKKKEEKLKKKNANKSEEDKTDLEIDELSATNLEVEDLLADNGKEEKMNALMMFLAVTLSIVISIGLFMILPVLIANLFKPLNISDMLMNFIEGIIRFAIFIGYIFLASRMNEIKRVFMYHGAEHKTINCIENGLELTVENVRGQSKEHKRCGTSFTLLVILLSLVFFMLLPSGNLLWRILSRVIFVPFIAGACYEFIKLAGKSENKIVDIISKPGLWMQGLTTKEPDDSMIEVAIQSVDAVLDWRTFLKTFKDEETTENVEKVEKVEKAEKTVKPEKAESKTKKVDKTDKVNNEVNTDDDADVINIVEAPATNSKNKLKNEKPVRSNNLNRTINTSASDEPSKDEEEDDEILKALDKFFDQDVKLAEEK